MSERSEFVPVTALRVGRTDVGAARCAMDDEALTLIVRIDSEERSLRLRFATIDSAQTAGAELTLVLRDGTRVSLDAPASFHDELFSRFRALPELTRTLRAFGSGRARRTTPGGRTTDTSEQQRFFAPFLSARRDASAAASDQVIEAFSGRMLSAKLNATLHQFAVDREPEPGPARRALEAELVDAAEPLLDALAELDRAAQAANDDAASLQLWRVWSAQLRTTFETADRVWVALDAALDAAHRRAASAAADARRRAR